MTVDEPAADLGVAGGDCVERPQPRAVAGTTAMFGEVGLAGEMRGITPGLAAGAGSGADGIRAAA